MSNTNGQEARSPPRHWKESENVLLRAAVAKFEVDAEVDWKKVAADIPERTHVQCAQRWTKVLRPGLRKGAWSEEEDRELMALFHSCSGVWVDVAKGIEGRSAKQCRERYSYNLAPELKKGGWTAEEDQLILDTQKTAGNRWAQIAKALPGRTENSVKTRAKSLARAARRAWSAEEDATIHRMHSERKSWGEIADCLPKRTKNACRTRWKTLKSTTTAAEAAKASPQASRPSKRPRLASISNNTPPAAPLPSAWTAVSPASTLALIPPPPPPSMMMGASVVLNGAAHAVWGPMAAAAVAAAASSKPSVGFNTIAAQAASSQLLPPARVARVENGMATLADTCDFTPLNTPGSTPHGTPMPSAASTPVMLSERNFPGAFDAVPFADTPAYFSTFPASFQMV